MKKVRLTEDGKNLMGALFFYLILIMAVIVLNARCEYLNNQKSVADETTTQETR